jgi:hypothetical protein
MSGCCTLADCSHETNHKEQKIKNAKRGDFKICKICNNKLPATLEYWHKQKRCKYGLRATCKKCQCVIQKEYRKTPDAKEKHRVRQKEWRINNTLKVREINIKSWHKNKLDYNSKRNYKFHNDNDYRDKKNISDKIYRQSEKGIAMLNKEKNVINRRQRAKKYRENNIDHVKEYNEKYRNENKDFIRKLTKANVDELKPAYIAATLSIPVKKLTPDILETQRIIIKLKRELKSNNIKIR